MKKTKLLMPLAGITALGAVVAPVAALTSCNSNSTCTVIFDNNDFVTETWQIEVKIGSCVARPADPQMEGYNFLGWFTNRQCTEPFDFSKPVTKTITLYGGWELQNVEQVIIDTSAAKTKFYQNETFDTTGLSVQVRMEDQSIKTVPEGWYTTNPYHGQKLETAGKISVVVTVGGKSSLYMIEVVPVVTELSVSTDYDFTSIPIGETISRLDFLVTAKYSDGTEKTVLDWESNIFPDGALQHTFTSAGTQDIIINYGGAQWSTKAYVYYTENFSVNLPSEIILPISTTTDKEFTSTKQITILDNGQPVTDYSQFQFVLGEQAEEYVSVDGTTGQITALKAPLSHSTSIQLNIRKDGVDIDDPIQIKVYDISDPQITFPTSLLTQYVTYSEFRNIDSSTGQCVIPDFINVESILGETIHYKIRLNGGSGMDNVKTLILPKNLHSIWDSKYTGGKTIQNIYFDGSMEEYQAIPSYTTWTNDFVTGVECYDGFLQTDTSRVKAEFGIVPGTSQYHLGYLTPEFTEDVTGATLQFDLSEIGATITTFTGIELYSYIEGGAELEIYRDGELMTETTNYTWDTTNKVLELEGLDAWKGTNLVIKAPGKFAKGGCALTVLNSVSDMKAKYYRKAYKVGDKFSKTALHVFYTFQDGTEWEIPTKYLTTAMDGTAIEEGYEFTEDDAGSHTITVSGVLSGITCTYPMRVNK